MASVADDLVANARTGRRVAKLDLEGENLDEKALQRIAERIDDARGEDR